MMDWGWAERYEEWAHGVFDSREAAIADATASCEPKTEVDVGHVEALGPGTFVPDDLSDTLERMDQFAADISFDSRGGPMFDVKDRTAAQADLTQALRDWADKHVIAADCWVMLAREKVVLQ